MWPPPSQPPPCKKSCGAAHAQIVPITYKTAIVNYHNVSAACVLLAASVAAAADSARCIHDEEYVRVHKSS